METGREGRLTDRGRKGGNGKRNVKSGALEVILAGNLSYHSDLVEALQQEEAEGEREKQVRTNFEVLCLMLSWFFHSNIFGVCLMNALPSYDQRNSRFFTSSLFLIQRFVRLHS